MSNVLEETKPAIVAASIEQRMLEQALFEFKEKCRAIFGKAQVDVNLYGIPLSKMAAISEAHGGNEDYEVRQSTHDSKTSHWLPISAEITLHDRL
jgi:hypothetical protein